MDQDYKDIKYMNSKFVQNYKMLELNVNIQKTLYTPICMARRRSSRFYTGRRDGHSYKCRAIKITSSEKRTDDISAKITSEQTIISTLNGVL